MNLARIDIVYNNEVNYNNLFILSENIFTCGADRRLKNIPDNNSSIDEVNTFLDYLETKPSTAIACGYVFDHKLVFTGIKYSTLTNMFLTMHEDKLYTLPNYKRNHNAKAEDNGKIGSGIVYTPLKIEWHESMYKDYNGNSEFFTDLTQEQDINFEVTKKWNNFVKQLDI